GVDDLRSEPLPHEYRCRSRRQKWGRPHCPEHYTGRRTEARIVNAQGHSHAENRKIEGTTAPDFDITHDQTSRCRGKQDMRDNLVMALAQIAHAIVAIEVMPGYGPLPRRTDQAHLSIEGNEHGRGIRRRYGPAP